MKAKKEAESGLQPEPAKKIRRTPVIYRNNPALSNLFRRQKQHFHQIRFMQTDHTKEKHEITK